MMTRLQTYHFHSGSKKKFSAQKNSQISSRRKILEFQNSRCETFNYRLYRLVVLFQITRKHAIL